MEEKKIIYEASGAKAVFEIMNGEQLKLLLKKPHYLQDLANEINAFHKHFWSNEEINWLDCCDNTEEYYFDFFMGKTYLKPIDNDGRVLFYDDLETHSWRALEDISC